MISSQPARQRASLIPAFTPDGRRLAIHEAAHAVIGVALDVKIEYVTLDYRRADEPLAHAQMAAQTTTYGSHAIVLLAGGAAEIKAFGIAKYDSDDRRECRELLAKCYHVPVTDPVVADNLRRCSALAAEAVNDDWPWIQTVATELLRRRRLTGDDVARLRPQTRRHNDTADHN